MAAPACGHPVDRQVKGVPAEYAALCDRCLISYQSANGIMFSRKLDAQADREREAGS